MGEFKPLEDLSQKSPTETCGGKLESIFEPPIESEVTEKGALMMVYLQLDTRFLFNFFHEFFYGVKDFYYGPEFASLEVIALKRVEKIACHNRIPP